MGHGDTLKCHAEIEAAYRKEVKKRGPTDALHEAVLELLEHDEKGTLKPEYIRQLAGRTIGRMRDAMRRDARFGFTTSEEDPGSPTAWLRAMYSDMPTVHIRSRGNSSLCGGYMPGTHARVSGNRHECTCLHCEELA